MKISVYAFTALAAATSFSCFVSATTAAVSRNRKIQKKNGSSSGDEGTKDGGLGPCTTTAECAIPGQSAGVCVNGECQDACTTTSDCYGLLGPTYSGVCVDGYCQFTYNPDWTFPVGGWCGYTLVNRCAIPPGLTHGVCREGYCQTGTSGSSCGQTSDCVVQTALTPPHAVCRKKKCQRGVCGDYCGQNSDCRSDMYCTNGTKTCVPLTNCSCKDFNNRE